MSALRAVELCNQEVELMTTHVSQPDLSRLRGSITTWPASLRVEACTSSVVITGKNSWYKNLVVLLFSQCGLSLAQYSTYQTCIL